MAAVMDARNVEFGVMRKCKADRCKCGKVIFQGAEVAMKEAEKQKARLPMWAYECRMTDKGTFHLTTRGGSSKYKVTPNVKFGVMPAKTVEVNMRTDPMASHGPDYIALLNDATPITKDEWIARCAARYQQRAGMEANEARQAAEASLENLNNDLTENPEDVADEDLTCWQD